MFSAPPPTIILVETVSSLTVVLFGSYKINSWKGNSVIIVVVIIVIPIVLVISFSFTAVSYTHLDVYKRQLPNRSVE